MFVLIEWWLLPFHLNMSIFFFFIYQVILSLPFGPDLSRKYDVLWSSWIWCECLVSVTCWIWVNFEVSSCTGWACCVCSVCFDKLVIFLYWNGVYSYCMCCRILNLNFYALIRNCHRYSKCSSWIMSAIWCVGSIWIWFGCAVYFLLIVEFIWILISLIALDKYEVCF